MRVLTLENVTFAYDAVDVLRGVSFEVGPGESVALLGPNGVGKTTLTKLIVGLRQPTGGHVVVGDESLRLPPSHVRHPEDLARQVGYVFQHPDQQLFAKTVFDEVAFGPTQLGFPHSEVAESVNDALNLLDLAAFKTHHPYDLPLPMRKLVTIAAAIAQRPSLLILDEPVQGMSRRHVDLVTSVVLGLVDQGATAMVVTHDLDFAVEACERAVVLQDGRVAFDGGMPELATAERQLLRWGLVPPMAAQISAALSLHGSPIRLSDVARRIAERVGLA